MRLRALREFKETVEIRSLLIRRLRAHRYFPVFMIVTALLLVACTHVWQRVKVINLVKEVSILHKESRRMVDEVQKVKSETAALSKSTRVEKYAFDNLNLERLTPDRLYTLIPEEVTDDALDDLETMFSSIKRMADNLPVLNQAQAETSELRPIRFEPEDDSEGRR